MFYHTIPFTSLDEIQGPLDASSCIGEDFQRFTESGVKSWGEVEENSKFQKDLKSRKGEKSESFWSQGFQIAGLVLHMKKNDNSINTCCFLKIANHVMSFYNLIW